VKASVLLCSVWPAAVTDSPPKTPTGKLGADPDAGVHAVFSCLPSAFTLLLILNALLCCWCLLQLLKEAMTGQEIDGRIWTAGAKTKDNLIADYR
jgi:hypothetical protein